jgi:hypothetical protein
LGIFNYDSNSAKLTCAVLQGVAGMTKKDMLLREIDTLPVSCLGEIVDFVEYIKQKQLKTIPETMRLSEAALAKDWKSPEEDAAWANL